MARRYRKHNSDYYSFYRFAFGLSGLFVLFLGSLWYTNKTSFYTWLWISITVYLLIIGAIFAWQEFTRWMRRMRVKMLLGVLTRLGLEKHVIEFIDRFGFDKKKGNWTHREHSFDWDRLRDLRKFLNEKGLHLSEDTWDDMLLLLKHYIQQKEEKVTRESIGDINNATAIGGQATTAVHAMKFSDLTGTGFENLLYRLFQAMGYTVQKIGRTGDQGGDLIANKDGNVRMLIQAKRYNNEPVGNAAVQDAVAAQKYYDCNAAMVVASSDFTTAAVDLAKKDNVWLVGKQRLNELLLQYLNESWS